MNHWTFSVSTYVRENSSHSRIYRHDRIREVHASHPPVQRKLKTPLNHPQTEYFLWPICKCSATIRAVISDNNIETIAAIGIAIVKDLTSDAIRPVTNICDIPSQFAHVVGPWGDGIAVLFATASARTRYLGGRG